MSKGQKSRFASGRSGNQRITASNCADRSRNGPTPWTATAEPTYAEPEDIEAWRSVRATKQGGSTQCQ